jgi:hypothetical protein
MSVQEILLSIERSGVAHAISKSSHLVVAGLQVVHVVGIILLLAALVILSLRLLGLVFQAQNVAAVSKDAQRLMALGFALAFVSGALMFIASPRHYFYNSAFQLKMILFVLAIAVQLFLLRRAARDNSPSPVFARVSASLALVLWFGVGLSGRVIGFI